MVYLIECVRDYETVYKIGYSKHPNKRLNELKTGNDGNLKVLYTFSGEHERKIESTLHRFYCHKKLNREWFEMSISDVNDFIPLCKRIEKNLISLYTMNSLLNTGSGADRSI